MSYKYDKKVGAMKTVLSGCPRGEKATDFVRGGGGKLHTIFDKQEIGYHSFQEPVR